MTALLLILLAGGPMPPGTIRVSLTINEPNDGVIATAFRNELRALDDVVLVDGSEAADYVLRVGVLCRPDRCDNAGEYFVVLQVARPLDGGRLLLPLQLALAHHSIKMPPSEAMQIRDELYGDLSEYERPVALRLARWTRDEYRSGVKDFVAQFDRECLAFDRLTLDAQAALAAHDSVNAAAFWREEARARRNSDLCAEQFVGQ